MQQGRGLEALELIEKALKDVNFKGYISIEYEANPKEPSPDIQACLEVFRNAVRKLG